MPAGWPAPTPHFAITTRCHRIATEPERGGQPLQPAHNWDEATLRRLDPTEHDFQEFKGSGFLVRDGILRSDFGIDLSRQISAFANSGGGHLFIGIDDSGTIDAGGLPVNAKNGLREWLEDVIPGSVDPPLKVFNVYEVRSDGSADSRLRYGHAVYVIHIPTSEDAPHQARDYRYYLRIAGKSRPMNHTHIVDVQGRQQHPHIAVTRMDPYGAPEWFLDDPRGPMALIQFRITAQNRGRVLAENVGFDLTLPRNVVVRNVRERLASSNTKLRQDPGFLNIFHYHAFPIFPQQDVEAFVLWIALHRSNGHAFAKKKVELTWRTFADDAGVQEGVLPFHYFNIVHRTLHELNTRHAERSRKEPDWPASDSS